MLFGSGGWAPRGHLSAQNTEFRSTENYHKLCVRPVESHLFKTQFLHRHIKKIKNSLDPFKFPKALEFTAWVQIPASPLTSPLVFDYVISSSGNRMDLTGLLRGSNEKMQVRHLAQCLAHQKLLNEQKPFILFSSSSALLSCSPVHIPGV